MKRLTDKLRQHAISRRRSSSLISYSSESLAFVFTDDSTQRDTFSPVFIHFANGVGSISNRQRAARSVVPCTIMRVIIDARPPALSAISLYRIAATNYSANWIRKERNCTSGIPFALRYLSSPGRSAKTNGFIDFRPRRPSPRRGPSIDSLMRESSAFRDSLVEKKTGSPKMRE